MTMAAATLVSKQFITSFKREAFKKDFHASALKCIKNDILVELDGDLIRYLILIES